jgi:hypothetical protein
LQRKRLSLRDISHILKKHGVNHVIAIIAMRCRTSWVVLYKDKTLGDVIFSASDKELIEITRIIVEDKRQSRC